ALLGFPYFSRGGAVAARQAHNLEVVGSNPTPGTTSTPTGQATACPICSPRRRLPPPCPASRDPPGRRPRPSRRRRPPPTGCRPAAGPAIRSSQEEPTMHPNPEDQTRELRASLVRTEMALAEARDQRVTDQVTIWILLRLLEQLRGKLAKAVQEIREH